MPPKTKVCICVCTFRRPEGLVDFITSCRGVNVPDDATLEIVVVDNDVTPSSQDIFQQEMQDFPWPSRYVHEPEPGIPSARNRALQEAGHEGYAVFVDDDETVSPEWITELFRVAKETKATFVQGPVQMTVDDDNDSWWLTTRFFLQNTFEDGAKIVESWTNNVMIDLAFTTEKGSRFEDRLRFDGGSDTLFFQDIISDGGTGAFAAHAWVHEVQPPNRLTWKWAINRQYRYGATRAMTVLLRRSRREATMYCLVRGCGMAAVGLALLVTTVVKGRQGIANGTALLARSAGILSGMVGKRALEYAR